MSITTTFCFYILAIAIISWWAYRQTRVTEDYFLGGRQLGASTAALSASASDMSGWLLLGLPGYAYTSGLESIWLSAGLCIGLSFCWLSMAKRLRVFSHELNNAITIPAYLQERFQDQTPTLRLVTAFFILLFFLFYVSAGFVAGAKLFDVVFATGYPLGLIFTFAFVVLYTFIGGFLAVSWSDVFQGLLMLFALTLAPLLVVAHNGGLPASLEHIDTHLLNGLTDKQGQALGLISIISLLAWGLGYFGQPHILARFKSIKHKSDITKASTIAISWSVIVNLGAILTGLFAIAFFASKGTIIADSEQVFILLTKTLFHPVIAGILLAAVLAAIMSTADSQLLVCSSAVAEDIVSTWNKSLSSEAKLRAGRVGVLAIGLCAMLLALDPNSKVLGIVSYAWAGLGAAFGPILLISLYSRTVSKTAAIVGIVTGGLTVIIWKNISGGWFELYELLPGFVFSSGAIFIVTFFTNEDQAIQQFERCMQGLK